MFRPRLMCACAAVALWAGLGFSSAATTIQAVLIETRGGVVDEGFVRERLRMREGETFDRGRLMQDVRTLEQTGRFADVQVDAEPSPGGIRVRYTIVPKHRISELMIEGADALGNRRVREIMALRLGDIVDEAVLAAGARRVQDEYVKKYRPATRIAWTLEPTDPPGTSRVRIRVKEAPRAVINDFQFAGVHSFSDETLRKAMLTRAYRWFNPVHWFSSAGRVDEDQLAGDAYRIRRFYADAGYLDAKVPAPRIEPTGSTRARAVFQVEEGSQYHIGRILFEGMKAVTEDELRRTIRLRTGDIASRQALDDAQDAILDYYGNRGYIRTTAEPRVEPQAEPGRADVIFPVKEGEISTIRDIRILGQSQTQDVVIRRELVVEPGEKFNRTRVRTSEQRLRNLGYFASVYSYPESTPDPAYSDLVFQVEEQRMGQASVGAGFSSIDSFTTFFELSHGNMQLSEWPPVGGGQKLRLRGTLGTQRTDAEIEFTEPYFLDRRLTFGATLYHRDLRYESSEYDIQRTGGEVSLSRPIPGRSRARLAYGLERINLYNMGEDVSDTIRAEEGARLKSFSTFSLTRETRDQLWAPTRGNNSRLLVGLAGGPLMGDTDWYKVEGQVSQYIPLLSTNRVVLLRARAGAIEEFGDSDRVPIFDRYFLGGPTSVRAFKYREVGPVDEDEEPLGGRSLSFVSAEYIQRVASMLRLSCYWDGGMVVTDAFEWGGRLNTGVGVGVYVDIPFLPIKFYYAWPLEADPHNDRGNGVFSFMIGHSF